MTLILSGARNVSFLGSDVWQSASRNETCQPVRDSMKFMRTRCVDPVPMHNTIGEKKAKYMHRTAGPEIWIGVRDELPTIRSERLETTHLQEVDNLELGNSSFEEVLN